MVLTFNAMKFSMSTGIRREMQSKLLKNILELVKELNSGRRFSSENVSLEDVKN